MGQMESVPFSALVAGMLLYNRDLSSASIVNMMSKLGRKNILVDDECDNLDDLRLCVDISSDYSFSLKAGVDYDTILYDDVTVYNFLIMKTNSIVLSFLGINCFEFEELNSVDSILANKKCDFDFSKLKNVVFGIFNKKNDVKVRTRRNGIVM